MKNNLVLFLGIFFLASCEMESMSDIQPDQEFAAADLLSEGVDTDMLNTQIKLESDLEASAKIDGQSIESLIDGCALGPGYWKSHSNFRNTKYDPTWVLLPNGPETPFYISDATWIEIFKTPPAGNAYYLLAHQFMAAKLNVWNVYRDVDPSAVLAELNAAEILFKTFTPAQVASLPKNSPERSQMLTLGSKLENFINSLSSPEYCD
ncbi:hypothetical protein [Algoriphagus machipongonensis]|uniref:Lipoprotein n=1 Tax=Algoriphagus machipongonensis TaxID=388413 RepID=A3HYR2_9BACT|nr:hypothetical protein [Algoriphagus machipongonensis]EAZ80398.1 hypothetical protein ALPR1_05730 [Algoriphagus machipongonensis]